MRTGEGVLERPAADNPGWAWPRPSTRSGRWSAPSRPREREVGDAAGCRDRLDVVVRLQSFEAVPQPHRSEEHTSELQSRQYLVCRLLLEKKKNNKTRHDDIVTDNLTLYQHLTW